MINAAVHLLGEIRQDHHLLRGAVGEEFSSGAPRGCGYGGYTAVHLRSIIHYYPRLSQKPEIKVYCCFPLEVFLLLFSGDPITFMYALLL